MPLKNFMRLFVAFYFNFALDILRANVNIYRNKGKLATSILYIMRCFNLIQCFGTSSTRNEV